MTEELQSAVSSLRAELKTMKDSGSLRSADTKVVKKVGDNLSLPATLREFYSTASPDEVEIPWTVEWLSLYSVESLELLQQGYRHHAERPEQLETGWEAAWVVIGDFSGNPIIVNTESRNAEVLLAHHGTGSWAPKRICDSLPKFLLFLVGWLKLWKKRNGDVRDEEGKLRTDVFEAIENCAAAHLGEADRERLMTFIG